jgi:tripartite-type tricarboxylate transporter receptor subunit TctC
MCGRNEELASIGAEPSTGTPEQFAKYLREEVDRYAKLVKEARVTAERWVGARDEG